MNGDMHAIGYEFEHRFSDKVKVSHKLRYFEADVAWNYLQAQTTAAALRNASERGLLACQYSDRREQVRGIVSDTNVTSTWQLLGMEHAVLADMLLSAAVYELTQTNVLKYDAGNDVYRQAGQVRSQGLELEAKAELGRGASLIASYAYTDARTTRSTIASEIGQRSEDTPFHQAALWLDYSFASLGLPQLKTGAGARYKGSTQPSGMSRSMPAYTVLDAMLSYRLSRNWQLTANVSNLGNKQYTYCEFAICTYGDQRHATATLS